MAQPSYELEFKGKLYEKYSQCQKYLIPKEVYYKIIEDLKSFVLVLYTVTVKPHSFLLSEEEECLRNT